MRAYFDTTGLSITVTDKDEASIDLSDPKKRTLECIVLGHNKTKISLDILDEVTKTDPLAESGFYMECYPPNVPSRESEKIELYLSKERWYHLTTVYDREAGGGFFASRCRYDRFHIHYYDFKKSST